MVFLCVLKRCAVCWVPPLCLWSPCFSFFLFWRLSCLFLSFVVSFLFLVVAVFLGGLLSLMPSVFLAFSFSPVSLCVSGAFPSSCCGCVPCLVVCCVFLSCSSSSFCLVASSWPSFRSWLRFCCWCLAWLVGLCLRRLLPCV